MSVAADGLVRCKRFQPFVEVPVKPTLVVVDEHRRRDVHGVDQGEPFLNAALMQAFFHLRRDVDERSAAGDIEPEFLAI
jgi:hypothetical protein